MMIDEFRIHSSISYSKFTFSHCLSYSAFIIPLPHSIQSPVVVSATFFAFATGTAPGGSS